MDDGSVVDDGPSVPPEQGVAASSWRDHFRSRAPVLVAMLGCAIVATLASAPYPPNNVEGMVALLSESGVGTVAPGDFVWEPSGGFLDDSILGRRILFLARSSPNAPRDLYRARVTVTRQGRPMRVRSTVNLSRTDLADERDLVITSNTAVTSAEAFGHVQNVAWLDLTPPPRRSLSERLGLKDYLAEIPEIVVSFTRPPKTIRYEVQPEGLVLSMGDDHESALVDRSPTLTTANDELGAYVAKSTTLAERSENVCSRWRSYIAPFGRNRDLNTKTLGFIDVSMASSSAPLVPEFPPSTTFEALFPPHWQGAVSPVAHAKKGNVELFALDMRQLELKVVVASEIPHSLTGHFPRGEVSLSNIAVPVLAIAGPSDDRGGATDAGVVVSPFLDATWTLTDGHSPHVRRGAAGGVEGSSTLGFPAFADTSPRERSTLCVTRSGHLVYSWGARETNQSMRDATDGLDCLLNLPIEGNGGMGLAFLDSASSVTSSSSVDPSMSMQWKNAGRTTPLLVFRQRIVNPSPTLPSGAKWESDVTSQPDPSFNPALYHAQIDALGTHVALHLFMPERFDWVIRAGDQEKTHRLGGTFVKALTDSEVARAFFAVGLGIGKRRSPLGLRIADSTGHAFRHQGGILEAGPGVLLAAEAHADDPDRDATEVPLTSSHGTLLAAARERGPRQLRADICALDDGTVLYAEADFDNHEATASVLTDLGCSAVVALDRGAERPAWSEPKDHLAKAHDTTALFALARPTGGSVSTTP